MNIKRIAATAGVAVLMLTAAACGGTKNSATVHNQKIEAGQEQIYNTNQPIPVYSHSQLRQTEIDVQNAQVAGAPTTSFFFNQGSPKPFSTCPSIGYPVSATDQLSNPEQLTRTGGNYSVEGAIPQIDPNGIYSGGASSGTYVLCINNSGKAYGFYWEGYVATVDGAATWDNTTGSISDVTNPTGGFKVLTPEQTKPQKPAPVTTKP